MTTIFESLNNWTQKQPDKTLFAFLDVKGREIEKYTYSEFQKRVEVIASNLQHQFDFEQNDRVLLAYPPGLEMICAFFACAKIGLIPVPVYPPSARGFQSAIYKITHIANDCEAKAILTSSEYYWSFKLNMTRNRLSNFSFKKASISKLDWIGLLQKILNGFSKNRQPKTVPKFCLFNILPARRIIQRA